MITTRKSSERGANNFGWLDAKHTFSFGRYIDRDHMNFRALRVLNEDHIAPNTGFGWHPHDNMEIVTVVLAGELRHEDSMGHTSIMRPGDLQRMSAGTGVFHAENNNSKEREVHLLQIWLFPEKEGLEPGYEQDHFDVAPGESRVIVTRSGEGGALKINQDVALHRARPVAGKEIRFPIAEGRHAWVQVAAGAVTANGVSLEAGDAAAISDETEVVLTGVSDEADVLVFDLA